MKLFFIQICIITINQLDGSWSKSINYEIDEFINRILSSDKFDELADKIAEKAARKIFDLDNIRISHNMNSVKTRNQESKLSQKRNILRENYVEETTQQIKEVKTKATVKYMELPPKQNFERDKHSSQQKLRLKYKNLSKPSRGIKNQNVYKINNEDLEVQSTKAEPVNTVSVERHSHKNRFSKVASHKGNELNTKNKSDITVENIKYSIEVKNEENENASGDKKNSDEDRISSKEKENKSNASDPSKELEIVKKKTKKQSKVKRQSQSKTIGENDSKNDNESKEKPSNEDSPKPTEDGEAGDDWDKEKESEDKDTKVRKSFDETPGNVIIRKEGDKLYAFENLPDYKDYHEKVKKHSTDRKEVLLKY